jgi:hypothetical protein
MADALEGYPFAASGATCYQWSKELRDAEIEAITSPGA